MRLLFDSFWRALAYCFRPTVVALSLLPLAVMAILAWVLNYVYWQAAVTWEAHWITSSGLTERSRDWLSHWGSSNLAAMLAPLLVLAAVIPLLMVNALLSVAAFVTPALVQLV